MKLTRGMRAAGVLLCFALVFGLLSAVRAAESGRVVRVASTAEIHTALKTALPGDEILVAPGTYVGKLGANASGFGSAYFNSDQSGTADAPIILRSEDPENPAVFIGERANTGYVLRLTGDHWLVSDIRFTGAQKGVMLDNANYCTIRNCTVGQIGQEGIHFRDGSSYNLLENCTVTDTGLQSPGFGEGIYVGSANSAWNEFSKDCNYNIIRGCTLGPNVAGEHIDIKEGTVGTVVEDCVMDGTGISGQNYADSFIDLKGNDAVIRNNTCYRNGNSVIVDAFQLHNQLEAWGNNNEISGNTLYLDDEICFVINATHDTSASTSGNARIPDGNLYTGDVTVNLLPPAPLEIQGVIPNADGSYQVLFTGGAGGYRFSAYLVSGGVVRHRIPEQTADTLYIPPLPEADALVVYVQDKDGRRAAYSLPQ